MADLRLALKGEYFDQIRAGKKNHEYRLITPYWQKRLVDREYDSVILTKGYPKRGDKERTLVRPWRGFMRIWLTHEHFGPDPVRVFAIILWPHPTPTGESE